MNINRDNYESYFLDHLEGKLSPQEEETLQRFLQFNPDLAKELESVRLLELPEEQISFPGKQKLKKQIPNADDPFNPDQFDFFCIAYLEGDLSGSQRAEMEKYMVENPSARKTLEKYREVHIPSEIIHYPAKQSLKRRSRPWIDWRIFTPIAAAAAIALYFFLGPQDATTPVEVASTLEPEKKTEAIKETIEETVKEKAADTGSIPATLNVIRTKSVPVPVSNYKPQDVNAQQKTQDQDKAAEQAARQRIAGTDLTPRRYNDPVESYDRIALQAVTPPAVNGVSLSLPDLARYQIQRATSIVEDDDDLLFNLASAGLKELNRRVGTESRLLASRDEAGEISGIQFRSRYFNLTAPLPGGDE